MSASGEAPPSSRPRPCDDHKQSADPDSKPSRRSTSRKLRAAARRALVAAGRRPRARRDRRLRGRRSAAGRRYKATRPSIWASRTPPAATSRCRGCRRTRARSGRSRLARGRPARSRALQGQGRATFRSAISIEAGLGQPRQERAEPARLPVGAVGKEEGRLLRGEPAGKGRHLTGSRATRRRRSTASGRSCIAASRRRSSTSALRSIRDPNVSSTDKLSSRCSSTTRRATRPRRRSFCTRRPRVEEPTILTPASADRVTARSRRNSVVVAGLIGLVLGGLAALLWDRVARARPPGAARCRCSRGSASVSSCPPTTRRR